MNKRIPQLIVCAFMDQIKTAIIYFLIVFADILLIIYLKYLDIGET